jgi:hypothetical protein
LAGFPGFFGPLARQGAQFLAAPRQGRLYLACFLGDLRISRKAKASVAIQEFPEMPGVLGLF